MMTDHHRAEEIRVHSSWQHGLDADTERRQFKAHGLAPSFCGPLGCDIARIEWQGDDAADRNGVDKQASLSLPEVRKECPGGANRTHQIRVELAQHLLIR